MGTPKLQQGARLILYINGNPVGIASDFSWASETPGVEIRQIDVDFPIEIGPGSTSVSGSMNIWKLINDSGAQSYGLTASQVNASQQKYVSLTLIDRGLDTIVFQCDYCKITREEWRVATKSLMTGTISFQGLVWTNNF